VGPKLKFVLSDLHLGAGYANEGNFLEDFTADEQVVHFLREISHESENDQREVELIINGDFFEFLQVPAVDHYDPHTIYPKEVYHDSSEAASVKRLSLIIKGHQEIFNALSDFMHVEVPQRRITIIKGNHDVSLYWPRVKSRLREALGASGSRSSLLLFAEKFVSRENIYVEHGHQQAEKMNCYHDHIDPRLPDDPTQLYYPVGSHFVINFFNDVERKLWFVDSVKPLTALIWFALQWDFNFAAKMLVSFIQHTPALVVSNFSPDNNSAISTDNLLKNLEDGDKCYQISQRYTSDPAFRQQFHQQISLYLDDANVANKSSAAFSTSYIDSDPLAMGRAEQRQQQAALCHAAEEIARQEGARIILFGHTHHPVYEILGTGSIYINTGCWLEKQDLSTASPKIWKALFNGTQNYDNLPGRLPYARLDYDEHNQPTAQLLDFANNNTRLQATDSQPTNFLARVFNRIITPKKSIC
jgi:UDP-2,3-diacylglucosamine pyrophosphatase LpxH